MVILCLQFSKVHFIAVCIDLDMHVMQPLFILYSIKKGIKILTPLPDFDFMKGDKVYIIYISMLFITRTLFY